MRFPRTAFTSCAAVFMGFLVLARAHPFENASPNTAPMAQKVEEGDPVRGREIFEKRCTGCHALDRDREGPRLQDVFGRTSGTVAGFDYSPALKQAHILWDDRTLDRWLADPDAFVPGNNMDFHVASPTERQDLIRFLRESAGK